MNDAIWYWIWLGAALVLTALLGNLFRRRWLLRAELQRQEQEEASARLREEIETGARLPDGHPACVICGKEPATERLPLIGLSWFERLNPLRTLYGAVRLYRRQSADADVPVSVCKTDRDLYASFMDEELADVRRQTAEFAAAVDRRISDLRAGGLVARARAYAAGEGQPKNEILMYTRPLRSGATEARPLLAALDVHHEQVASSAQTSNGKSVEKAAN